MKRKKLIAFLMAACIISATSATVYATFTDSVAVDSHISTGIVDIDLTEYQEGDNGREAYEDFKVVLPGDLISKIPTVTNKESHAGSGLRLPMETPLIHWMVSQTTISLASQKTG